MYCHKGSVICYLTDCNGKMLDLCCEHPVMYSEYQDQYGKITIEIKGFILYERKGIRCSSPVPFCIYQPVNISASCTGPLLWRLKCFSYQIVLHQCQGYYPQAMIELKLNTGLVNRPCFCVQSKIRLLCQPLKMITNISHYSVIADGIKRIYVDSDEMKEYANEGILPPDEVSYYDLFVNGSLLPKNAYRLRKGKLEFLTEKVPQKGQPVNLVFVTIRSSQGVLLKAEEHQYNTVYHAGQMIFTNEHELTEYGSYGIPDPAMVSNMNLYVNAVLQPVNNYQISKGRLELITIDEPAEESMIILKSLILRGEHGELIPMCESRYQTYSIFQKKRYCNQDKIRMYCSTDIKDKSQVSFQCLYINGVLQPQCNFCTKANELLLLTEDTSVTYAPVILQSYTINDVSVFYLTEG